MCVFWFVFVVGCVIVCCSVWCGFIVSCCVLVRSRNGFCCG